MRKRVRFYSGSICRILVILAVLVTLLAGCRKSAPAQTGTPAVSETKEETVQAEDSSEPEEPGETEEPSEPEEPSEEPEEPEQPSEPEAAPQIDENGSYTTKEDVALYLHVYGRLPSNFITKKEAKELGWTGGSLEEVAPGMCIGGDYFGNYEGILPQGNYRECDIDTLGRKKRGSRRIIYSDDGRIYYTGDHYETFELLYGEED